MVYNDLIVLVPSHSLEDFPTELPEEKAEGLLNAFAVLWHPRLLASARVLPGWHRADEPPQYTKGRLIIVPDAAADRVPAGWADRARSEGAVVVEGLGRRGDLVAAALAPLDVPATDAADNDAAGAATESEPPRPGAAPPVVDPELVADFLALGTCHLQTELLTRHMHHFTNMDEAHLKREAIAAADAALADDEPAARAHLRTCFEVLLEARERFYPVDCYLIDLCLLIPDLAGAPFEKMLARGIPVSIAATGVDLEVIADKHPAVVFKLKQLWEQGEVDLIGGEYRERPSPLLPLESVLWDFQRGHAVFQKIFGRTPTTWGRRRFGLSTLMPQILSRLGYRAAMHLVLDDGLYPDAEHSKIRWEGCDGTVIDAISRIPLAADAATSFLRFAPRMAESMEQDQVAAVLFARWPEMKTPWFHDLERMQAYAPVLGRFTTLDKFFHQTDDPGRLSKYQASEYLSPFFIQAVARQERDPISRFLDHVRRRAAFDAGSWCSRTARVLTGRPVVAEREAECEAGLEEAGPDLPETRAATSKNSATAETAPSAPPEGGEIDARISEFAGDAARELANIVMYGASGQPGYLVLNSLSFPRTVTVDLPELAAPPAVQDAIRGVQFDDRRRAVTLHVPGSGYVWLPRSESAGAKPPAARHTLAEPHLLRNEFFEVYINEETGGIAEIKEYGRRPNRLSQQLAFRFPRERTISIGEGEARDEVRTYYSAMRRLSSSVTCEGPGMGEIVTEGEVVDQVDGSRLAGYRQTVRVWRGRRDVEIEIELDAAHLPDGDPWSNYYASRFAWHDSDAALTRSLQQGAQTFTGERFESPHYLEIANETERVTILNGGLPFHRKTGPRMVDSILLTAGETRRRFQFRVAIDASYPMQAALDALSPAVVVPTTNGPPRTGTKGWFFHLDASNVQILRVLELVRDPSTPAGDDDAGGRPIPSSRGFALRLVETEGRYRSGTLRCFKTPTSARQRDLRGTTVAHLKIIDDGVHFELAAYEIADLDLHFADDARK